MRGQNRSRNWPEGSQIPLGAVGFDGIVGEGEGRSEYCGNELRRSLVSGEGAVVFVVLNEGSGGKVRRSRGCEQ